MKDIPVFTTEFGIASLVLKEIPYCGDAYIRVRSVQNEHLKELLSECATFCRMAGAEKLYATGYEELEDYPLHATIFEMRGTVTVEPENVEHLFPVTEETVAKWRSICNDRMSLVDCAATLTVADEKTILESGGAYFVHRGGQLLGIGWLSDGELRALAAVKPGAGLRVLHTLLSAVDDHSIRLEVASTNTRAIHLYEKCGLIKTKEKTRWYRI